MRGGQGGEIVLADVLPFPHPRDFILLFGVRQKGFFPARYQQDADQLEMRRRFDRRCRSGLHDNLPRLAFRRKQVFGSDLFD